MNSNIIIDALPYSVTIDDDEVEVNTDFRSMMITEMLILNPEISKEDKVAQVFYNFYGENIPVWNLDESAKKFLWFYLCGEPEEAERRASGSSGRIKRIYDFEYDAPLIYAAFLSQYGIDLQEIEYLHWWKFKAMFNSLRNSLFVEVMQCRAVKITKNMGKEQKAYYQRMKDLYRLPDGKNVTESKKEKELIAALQSGDVSAVESLKRGG